MYLDTMPSGRPDGSGEAVIAADGPVRFRLLGPVELLKDGVDHAPTRPKILQLLALLVAHPGKIVHIDSIVEELWESRPPRSVRTTMHTYVYLLRRSLAGIGLSATCGEPLVTKPRGYQLRINPAQVDVFPFHRRCEQGRELLAQHSDQEAAHAFRSALDMWTGRPIGNVQCGSLLSAYAVDLLEQRRGVRHLWIEAEINAGKHHELVGELTSLAAANPLDESLHGQLMRVLALSGRRPDALGCYRQLRRRLNDELGIEPCNELRLLHLDMLSEGEPGR